MVAAAGDEEADSEAEAAEAAADSEVAAAAVGEAKAFRPQRAERHSTLSRRGMRRCPRTRANFRCFRSSQGRPHNLRPRRRRPRGAGRSEGTRNSVPGKQTGMDRTPAVVVAWAALAVGGGTFASVTAALLACDALCGGVARAPRQSAQGKNEQTVGMDPRSRQQPEPCTLPVPPRSPSRDCHDCSRKPVLGERRESRVRMRERALDRWSPCVPQRVRPHAAGASEHSRGGHVARARVA